ncbi:hypothetical protein K1719_018864 [Acacia pycnantha]|nr:hypothetical protein K1719_018864 [Acacia pycnantha]
MVKMKKTKLNGKKKIMVVVDGCGFDFGEMKNGMVNAMEKMTVLFKEGEAYVKQCLEIKDWWAIAITFYQNKDCAELYIRNLLACIPIVVEAIESAGISVTVTTQCGRKIGGISSTKSARRGCQVRRRLGNSGRYKEIIWLGESFVIRQISRDVQALEPEITSLLSLSHTNIMEFLCGFVDNDKKDCLLVMGLMSRNLSTYIKDVYKQRKRIQFTLPVAVDLMLQIAGGMEYLHSKKIYHEELNPLKIVVKPRGSSSEGYMHAKILGFGLSSVKNLNHKVVSNQNGTLPLVLCDSLVPLVDYYEVELALLKKLPSWGSSDSSPISQIPFQMFAYGVMEKEKISLSYRESSDIGSDASACGDEHFTLGGPDGKSRKLAQTKKMNLRGIKQPGSHLVTMSSRIRRASHCHVSDSELP